MRQTIRILQLAVMALILNACAQATLVETAIEPAKGGVVKYNNSEQISEKSANKAKRIMEHYCGPQGYKLVKETPKQELVAAQPAYSDFYDPSNPDIGFTPVKQNFIYLQFRCSDSRTPAASE